LTGKSDADVVFVTFLRSSLEKVPPAVIKQFPNLNFLDLSFTGITKAEENFIEDCGKLRSLELSGNDISSINEGFLDTCKQLRNLWIDNNLISSISPWNILFSGSKQLSVFSLFSNPCVDESFTSTNFRGSYKNGSSKPLRACFESFFRLNAVAAAAPLAFRRSLGVEKEVWKFE
jgi:Leucine-rich repeat (LRR) protein